MVDRRRYIADQNSRPPVTWPGGVSRSLLPPGGFRPPEAGPAKATAVPAKNLFGRRCLLTHWVNATASSQTEHMHVIAASSLPSDKEMPIGKRKSAVA